MSTIFYERNYEFFKECPTSPLTNVEAIGFSGQKSRKIKKQLTLNLNIAGIEKELIVFVVPKLIENFIYL